MWILARVLTALVVGLFKYYWRKTSVQARQTTGGVLWLVSFERDKSRIVATHFGLPFSHPVFFRLSRERGWDRYFKRIGFAHELQTGDSNFDDEVYVACDHPALAPVLQADEEVRAAILELFESGATRIYTDGANLWVRRRGNAPPDQAALALLVKVRDALDLVPTEEWTMLKDRCFWRALTLSAVVWSLALYGLPALIEFDARKEPLYFDWGPVVEAGLGAALAIFVLLVGLARMLLRGSSRTHQIFIESAVVLLLGLPFSSVQLVSDVNRSFDTSAPYSVRGIIQQTYTTVTHSRSGTHTHYHVRLAPGTKPTFSLPSQIEVSPRVFRAAYLGGSLIVDMRDGAFGLPWVESIHAEP